MKIHFRLLLFLAITVFLPLKTVAQKFIHPGINQSVADLAYMKQQVLKGAQPWKDAFERLKAKTDLNFEVKAHTHVLRGPYGKPNIGGDDLSKGANMAYNCAVLWYITNDKAYAKKAIEIINAWSPVIWDLDYNDAKLLAAWTGHVWCNAAEILRYTDSGWRKEDVDRFSNMLMTVYYPLFRFYYPQANGNWDGAIIHSILAMGIFTDNRVMFDNAVNHFLHGPVNASIIKYIYPSGQCQETMRDQGHVQLGLGEFAGAAHIAYTQGTDLFSVGNNRLALGYEFTAKFLLGEKPHAYGRISERAKAIRDDYEYVYRHYSAKGYDLPYTRQAADSARSKASISILTATRAPVAAPKLNLGIPKASGVAPRAGAKNEVSVKAPANAVYVDPGKSLQEALDFAAGKKVTVIAKAGVHKLPATLKIPSGTTLAGEGIESILFLDPASGLRDAVVNAEPDLHDVTIRDLVIEGGLQTEIHSDPNSTRSFRSGANRGGIMFLGLKEGQMKNITLTNLTVRNCTYNGVFISGSENVTITSCDLNENGSNVVPGPKLQHNLLITHSSKIIVKDSRLDTSPYGSGIALGHCRDAAVINCEIARNAWYGILISESGNISVTGNLVEGNDRSGVMAEFLSKGSENVTIKGNTVQYNDGFGLEVYSGKNIKADGNHYTGNGNESTQEKISNEKFIIMN
jgi:parallel beta-helix repeat protein